MLKTKKGETSVLFGDSVVKVDLPGKALCKYCDHLINYASRGKDAILMHLKSTKHVTEVDHRQSNYTLGADFGKNTKPALFPLFSTFKKKNESEWGIRAVSSRNCSSH